MNMLSLSLGVNKFGSDTSTQHDAINPKEDDHMNNNCHVT
jgi:hypothetical protein